jgi:hypothetical protein
VLQIAEPKVQEPRKDGTDRYHMTVHCHGFIPSAQTAIHTRAVLENVPS